MAADTSLYDYLGRPAGPKLGAFVAKVAHQLGHEISERHVVQGNYDGLVNLYCDTYLQWFFNEPTFESYIQEDLKEFKQRRMEYFKNQNKKK